VSVDVSSERSLAQLLGLAVDLYRRYPLYFMLLAIGVVLPYDLAVLAAAHRGPFGGSDRGFELFVPANAAHLLLIAPLISALLARAVFVLSEGRTLDLQQITIYGLRVLPTVIVTQVICYLGIGLATVFLIIPGILLGLRWCVVSPVVALENEGSFGAMGRSGRLAAGHYWRIFRLTIMVEGMLVAVAFGVHALPLGGNSSVVMMVLEVIVQIAMACYVALCLTVLYFDLWARYKKIDGKHNLVGVAT
jgi:hypothetical protein